MDKKEILNSVIEGLKLPAGKSSEQAWAELQQRLNLSDATPVREIKKPVFKKLIPFMAAASVALAVLFFSPFNADTSAAFSTEFRESKVIQLADGSEVNLGPNSELTFEVTEDVRTATLKGEAFFQVEKGIPFKVETSEGNIKVLGTSFNVNSRANMLDVKCFTGKVEVSTENGLATLTKGLGVNSLLTDVYEHSSILKTNANGNMFFDQQPLNSVLEDLKHYKGFDIINKSEVNPVISLEIENESITEVCEILEKITSLKMKMVGQNKVELY